MGAQQPQGREIQERGKSSALRLVQRHKNPKAVARALSVPHLDLQGGVFPPSVGPFQQWGPSSGETRQSSFLKTRRRLSPSVFPTTHTHTHAHMHAHTHTHTNKTKCTSLTSIPLYLLFFLLKKFCHPLPTTHPSSHSSISPPL